MQYHKLKNEVSRWQQTGIITGAQAERILALYDHELPAYKTMRFWLLSLAVVLLGFALFLVISANWQRLPYLAQSLIALCPLLVAQFFAVRSELREQKLAADLSWFAASIAFGANIMLQAQIFHISAYYPNGVLFWLIGLLPVLWLRPSTTNYLLASALFFIYMGMQIEHGQFSALSALPLLMLARSAYERQTALNTLVLLFTLYIFAIMLMIHREIKHPGMLWELSHLALALALVQRFSRLTDSSFSLLLTLISLGFYLLALIATFVSGADWLIGRKTLWLPIVLSALAGAAMYQIRQELRERQITVIIVAGMFALLLLGLIASAIRSTGSGDAHLVVRIGANAIYVLSLVALLLYAIRQRAKKIFLSAATGLLLWTWIRYLDLFRDYLVTALIFALSAFALMALNKFWERRYEQ